MQSHTYDFSIGEFSRALLPTLAWLTVFATILHTASALSWLPGRPITLQADEAVLRHQVRASQTGHPAKIVLVGDSTCHAAVDAGELSHELPGNTQAINLGLIIGIDLESYAEIASDFAAANPDQVRWIVLLICPLKMTTRGDNSLWRQFRDEARQVATPKAYEMTVQGITGGQLLRERLASRLIPKALRGKGAGMFGFTTGLDHYMTEHNGSIVDFGELTPRSTSPVAELQVAEEFKIECGKFRDHLPKNVKLAVGLTSGPSTVPKSEADNLYLGYLNILAGSLRPDLVLTNLPSTLPTPCFSQSVHMNALGQKLFTSALATELSRELSGIP